jgi:hypothetical protein
LKTSPELQLTTIRRGEFHAVAMKEFNVELRTVRARDGALRSLEVIAAMPLWLTG